MSPSPEAQSPAGDLASTYPPKPLLFTLLGVGACDMLEQIEKLLRYRTIEQGLQNCRNIGHSYARADQETVEVSNYRAGTSKLSQYWSLEQSYTVLTHGFACTSPSPEAQSPAGDLASAYPPKPLLFTLLGVGACDMLEQIKKLSSYRTIEYIYQAKLSSYRTIESSKTVELSNYRVMF